MFHGYLNYFQEPPPGGNPNTEPRDHGTPNAHKCWLVNSYFIMCEEPHEHKFIQIASG